MANIQNKCELIDTSSSFSIDTYFLKLLVKFTLQSCEIIEFTDK